MITRTGQWVKVYANQGMRDARVLAILDDQALIEYEMPNGTTALRVVECNEPENTIQRFSYASVPNRWLTELYFLDCEWTGKPQQGAGHAPSVRALYEKRHPGKGTNNELR